MKKYNEFKKEYKDYDIEVYGRPLDKPTIPFTMLPKDKPLDECEVVDFKVIEKIHTNYGVSFKTMKPIKPENKRGYVRVYVK